MNVTKHLGIYLESELNWRIPTDNPKLGNHSLVTYRSEHPVMFSEGMVVRSKAGHDKGCFFVVVKVENGFAYIADGMNRTVLEPKKKNPLHLAGTMTVLNEQSLLTDGKICEIIAEFSGRLA